MQNKKENWKTKIKRPLEVHLAYGQKNRLPIHMNEGDSTDRDQVKAAPWATTKKYEAGSEDNAMNVL